MSEFYENLWSKKLGRLESLRRAQVAMRDYNPQSRRIEPRGVGGKLPGDAGRGMPFFWAGFVLSGDWR